MNLEIFSALTQAIGEGVQALEEEYAKAAEDKLPSLKSLSDIAANLSPDHAAYRGLTTTLSKVRQEMAGVPHDIYLAYESLVRGLESDVGGITNFVRAHGLSVHPAFARTVEALGLPPVIIPTPQPDPIPASEPVLAEPVKSSKSKKASNGNEESRAEKGSEGGSQGDSQGDSQESAQE